MQVVTGLLAWPAAGAAQLLPSPTQTLSNTIQAVTGQTAAVQTVAGQAAAVRATVLGLLGGTTTTALADTGTLSGATDARNASQLTGNIPSLLIGEALHATTIGWPDQVASEASLAGLALSVAGTGIGADFVKAEALAILNGGSFGTAYIDNLTINGVRVPVSGTPNQTISVPGGQVVINEQQSSASGIVVNALHVIVNGVADVVIGSASAGI
jgi:hypothetical protein